MSKSAEGNFFEDFRLGQRFRHATPRTLCEGDRALYIALSGSRFALHCAETFAHGLGLPAAPLDDLLVFHVVFGKTVPDISLNAVANLGYAECRFGLPVYAGDTLSAESEVIGLKESSGGTTGVVYVRSRGENQRGETVLEFKRWVLVSKRQPESPAPSPRVPALAPLVAPESLTVPRGLDLSSYDAERAGSPWFWEDFAQGERIDHREGMTLEEAEHQIATRLYQNQARVHFDRLHAAEGRFGRRIVYGGQVISLARALSFNGLGNALCLAAINGGRHLAPTFAGDTLYAWSQVLAKAEAPGRRDLAFLRLRTLAVKNQPASGFPDKTPEGKPDPSLVLDLDYWTLMPRRG